MRRVNERGPGRVGFVAKIKPSSPVSELLGWNEAGELCIRVKAPPHEGKANKELIRFLSRVLSVKKRDIRIESGERARIKILSVPKEAEKALLSINDIKE